MPSGTLRLGRAGPDVQEGPSDGGDKGPSFGTMSEENRTLLCSQEA